MDAAVAVIGPEADENYVEYTEGDDRNTGTFRFRPDSEIVSQIDRRPDLSQPDLDYLLTSYLSLMCDYGGLPAPRHGFVAEQEFVPALDALAASGYASKLNGQYGWTAAVAPHMRSAHVGSTDARPLERDAQNLNRHPGLDPGSTFLRPSLRRRWMPDQVRHDETARI